MFHLTRSLSPREHGLTLIEVLISLALMLLLSIITVQGMIVHGRMAHSNMMRERIADGSRRFVEGVQVFALDATVIRVDTGPAGPQTVLTLGKTDPSAGNIVYKEYAYLDEDNNPATIKDNSIVERSTFEPLSTSGKVILQYCSPVAGTPVFERESGTARPLYTINLRVGDRTYPANDADNAITGQGYQSFLINANFSQI